MKVHSELSVSDFNYLHEEGILAISIQVKQTKLILIEFNYIE
jgi:hypothetical protein